jgi:hypothetical protein
MGAGPVDVPLDTDRFRRSLQLLGKKPLGDTVGISGSFSSSLAGLTIQPLQPETT